MRKTLGVMEVEVSGGGGGLEGGKCTVKRFKNYTLH
jgi:hypothetical protein